MTATTDRRENTYEQDNAIEQMALNGARVAVNRPYTDGSVEVTSSITGTWLLSPAGTPTRKPIDNSIKWSA